MCDVLYRDTSKNIIHRVTNRLQKWRHFDLPVRVYCEKSKILITEYNEISLRTGTFH